MLTVAILASKFDWEFLGWVNKDGTEAKRPPRNDPRYLGAGGVPPDLDMKVRVKRLW